MPYIHEIELPPGKGSCGCRGCGEVFTCVSAFDRHQTLRPEDEGGGVICHDPEARGLQLYARPDKTDPDNRLADWCVWGWPPREGGSIWDDATGETQDVDGSAEAEAE